MWFEPSYGPAYSGSSKSPIWVVARYTADFDMDSVCGLLTG